MSVLLFAGLAEVCGRERLVLELPLPAPVSELRRRAARAVPELEGRSFRVAVDARYADEDEEVPPGAEVAFLPPVSGG